MQVIIILTLPFIGEQANAFHHIHVLFSYCTVNMYSMIMYCIPNLIKMYSQRYEKIAHVNGTDVFIVTKLI